MTEENDHLPKVEVGAAAKLSKTEITSVLAVLAYTAHHQKVSEDLVKEVVVKEFGVDDISQLKRQSYEDVIRFLVDLQIDTILN